ncbi:MAG: tRNA dihydrouridine(20/20a) synthase DusA [Rhodospirillaceae bacterium]|nr:tRNA dihydrouridine(20/20a) synthase DusA [Rhodospirillaceae bacterium]
MAPSPHTLSIAPMMDCTDRHFRYLARLISRRARLYTEMVTANAIVHTARGGRDLARFLGFNPEEHPVALQLGGSDPALMAEAALHGARAGFDEINLNIGCPSDRVQSGQFGACLMAEPALVAACVRAMGEALAATHAHIPITVKTRIGIDHQDSDAFLDDFVGRVNAAGCDTFVIHARKAWLSGLSPKENREIPPLQYDRVFRLKTKFPHLAIGINGGIKTLAETHALLAPREGVALDGVMIGRAAYDAPYALLAEADRALFGDERAVPSEAEVAALYLDYAEREATQGVRLHLMLSHAVGLFAGQPGARAWRRALSRGHASSGDPSRVLAELRARIYSRGGCHELAA